VNCRSHNPKTLSTPETEKPMQKRNDNNYQKKNITRSGPTYTYVT